VSKAVSYNPAIQLNNQQAANSRVYNENDALYNMGKFFMSNKADVRKDTNVNASKAGILPKFLTTKLAHNISSIAGAGRPGRRRRRLLYGGAPPTAAELTQQAQAGAQAAQQGAQAAATSAQQQFAGSTAGRALANTQEVTSGNQTADLVVAGVQGAEAIAQNAGRAAVALEWASGAAPALANLTGVLSSVGRVAGPLGMAALLIQMGPTLIAFMEGKATGAEVILKFAYTAIPGFGQAVQFFEEQEKDRLKEIVNKQVKEDFDSYIEIKQRVDTATNEDMDEVKKAMDKWLESRADDGTSYGDSTRRLPFPASEPTVSENVIGDAHEESQLGAPRFSELSKATNEYTNSARQYEGKLLLTVGGEPRRGLAPTDFDGFKAYWTSHMGADQAGYKAETRAAGARGEDFITSSNRGPVDWAGKVPLQSREDMDVTEGMVETAEWRARGGVGNMPADKYQAGGNMREMPRSNNPFYAQRKFYDDWASKNNAQVVSPEEFYQKKQEKQISKFKDEHNGLGPNELVTDRETKKKGEEGAYLTPEERTYMFALPEGDPGKNPTAVMALFKKNRDSGLPAPVPGTGAAPVAVPTSEPGFQPFGPYPAPQTQEEQDKFNEYFAVGSPGYSAEGLQTQDDQFQYWRAHDPTATTATGTGKKRRGRKRRASSCSCGCGSGMCGSGILDRIGRHRVDPRFFE
jgi:hypothetical protein